MDNRVKYIIYNQKTIINNMQLNIKKVYLKIFKWKMKLNFICNHINQNILYQLKKSINGQNKKTINYIIIMPYK